MQRVATIHIYDIYLGLNELVNQNTLMVRILITNALMMFRDSNNLDVAYLAEKGNPFFRFNDASKSIKYFQEKGYQDIVDLYRDVEANLFTDFLTVFLRLQVYYLEDWVLSDDKRYLTIWYQVKE